MELVVRGNCSLVTGIAGISENIHINGIIDRYLEHSRIFIFANGGEEKYYIGSADWMPRNLDNRIEVLAPVYDKEIQADLKRIVCYGYRDTAKGRIVDGTGENRPWENRPPHSAKTSLLPLPKQRQPLSFSVRKKNYIENTRIYYDKYEES